MKKVCRNLALFGCLIVAGSILSVVAYSSCNPPITFDPNNLAGSGYQLVYDEEFGANSLTTDVSFQAPSAATAGYKLYTANNIGCGIKPSSQFSINADGSLHNAGYNGGCGWDLASTAYAPGKTNGPAAWQAGWVGTAFGQGFYEEAKIKYVQVCDTSTPPSFAHPAFWGDPVEAAADPNLLNPGSMSTRFVELDNMEWACSTPNTIYFNNSHDWWSNMTGHIQVSNNITPPAGTDLTNYYHVYGQLWVYGGTNGSCATGYRQAYFDGAPVGNKITWQDCDETTTPPTGTNIGNAIDGEHLMVIIGTGVSAPMDTAWIHVWQIPASATASGNTAIPVSDVTVTAVSYNTTTHQFGSTIQNIGSVATPATTNIGVSYEVDGTPQTYGDASPLAAGASVAVGNQGPTYTIPSGTHTITAYVNDVIAFPEANRNNNKLSASITVP